MEFVYSLTGVAVGAVLGIISTIIYVNHVQEKRQAELAVVAPMSVAQMYAYVLDRFSKPPIPRLRQTHTLSKVQKDLLDVLGKAGDIVEQVRTLSKQPEHLLPRFLVNLNDTEFDRNGCVELWVDVSDNVSEVYYLIAEQLPIIISMLDNLNATHNKQLALMAKGITK